MIKIFVKIIFRILHLFDKDRAANFIGVKFGTNCRLISKDYGTEPWLISIGDNVTITDGVKFLTHDGSTCLAKDEKGRRYKYGKISIGNNVFIGVNSIIFPDVTIGNNVIIGAGSVVNKAVLDNSVCAGNPIREIGKFDKLKARYISELPSDADMNPEKSFKENIEHFINE